MKITEVKILNIKGESKIVATANITIENSLVIKDLKIVSGTKGLFVSMPSKKNHKGEYEDIVFPITKELRQEIQDRILNEYTKHDTTDVEQDKDLPF